MYCRLKNVMKELMFGNPQSMAISETDRSDSSSIDAATAALQRFRYSTKVKPVYW